uniref:Uncharacterized protein n=1 Tax=Branchiostoma floridae TaxID=7739 RepID=C3Y9L2_BRAFL|eukprot:XP_002607258.1 hypothetical protein BRAFLDRAFT_88206 [Branchiostoma floridae]
MVREKNADFESPEKTKRYRTRSGKTKPWNTPAKEIQDFEQVTEDHTDSSKTKVCNLKIRTTPDRVSLWIDASRVCFDRSLAEDTGYKFTWKKGNVNHPQLSVTDPAWSGENAKVVTIHYYHTGTILIHGKGTPWFAKDVFPQIKKEVDSIADVALGQDGGLENEGLEGGKVETKDDDTRTIESTSECGAQDGGLMHKELEADVDKTKDDDAKTMETTSECEASAMTAPDSDLEQTTNLEPVTVDLTKDLAVEKDILAENTTPKSLRSPSIRKVLGGLENIFLTPFTKVRESAGKNKMGSNPQLSNPRSRQALKMDLPKEPETSAKLPSTDYENMYITLVDDINELKTLVFSNKVTMDKQGKLIASLQANLQNRKVVIDKQSRQIENLGSELQRQREITKNLTDTLASQKADHDALQAQVLILTNRAQTSNTQTRPVDNKAQKDDSRMTNKAQPSDIQTTLVENKAQKDESRINRLYSEIVTGGRAQNPITDAAPNTKSSAPAPGPAPAQTDGNTTASTPTENDQGVTTQVRIFADSLWNNVDPEKIYKHKRASISKTTTLPRAAERIIASPDPNTELVIIHVASNDLDNTKNRPDSVATCVEQTHKVIESTRECFPNAKIGMSQVLPRGTNMNSKLNRNIASYNDAIESY